MQLSVHVSIFDLEIMFFSDCKDNRESCRRFKQYRKKKNLPELHYLKTLVNIQPESYLFSPITPLNYLLGLFTI